MGTERRIDALVKLLGDENPRVSGPAREHLLTMGDRAVPRLQRAALYADDAALRLRARKFLRERRQHGVLEEWAERCAREDLGLEDGAILISRSEYPHETAGEVRERLDEWAAVMRRRLAAARTTEIAVRRTVDLLAGELGFTGLGVDYEDPDASHLHRVLETRRGLPILLSTVYLLIARRAGVPLYGVGMPQHFLLKYPAADGEYFLDPFRNGRSLTRFECKAFLESSGVLFRASYLRAVADHEILSRMLGNLLRVYHASQDRERLGRVIAMLRRLEGLGEPSGPGRGAS